MQCASRQNSVAALSASRVLPTKTGPAPVTICVMHAQVCVFASLQACHDLVPPDWLQPVMRHLCNQFVHDRARPEEITVGLKTVREICMRMPLIMSEEVLLVRLLMFPSTCLHPAVP